MNSTDSELLNAAQARDAAAVGEILGRHEKQVFRFGMRLFGLLAESPRRSAPSSSASAARPPAL